MAILLVAVAGKEGFSVYNDDVCSSMVIRDLTLRSAASFGSFHLIRLLYDEYMFYLVEQRLARSAEQCSIAVMAQVLTNNKSHHSSLLLIISIILYPRTFIQMYTHAYMYVLYT